MVHGDPVHRLSLLHKTQSKAYGEHIYPYVPYLRHGKPFIPTVQAYEREEHAAAGQHLHLLYLPWRVPVRVFLTQIQRLSVGLQRGSYECQRADTPGLRPFLVRSRAPVRENSGQTMKTIEKLSCLLYYVQRLFTKILSLFKEGFMRHLMSPLDFSVEELEQLLKLAGDIEANPKKYAHACDGKKLATLFYEASTRTRLSHEAAMLNLGGSILGFSSADSSSAAKGESVADTIRTVSCYADICAIRHPKEGAALVASQYSSIPVINAGDGGHQHPTQTLTDLLTIYSLKGRLDNMTIGLCGDLKFGRTVHSLIQALVRYPNIRFILISPEELKIPGYIRTDVLERQNIGYEEVVRLEDALPSLDLLYMTRVQRERFFNEEDYIRMKDFYILDSKKMELAPKDMHVLHPLPRVNEISVEVDNDPRAAYFKQAQYGVYVRMALIMTLLDIEV